MEFILNKIKEYNTIIIHGHIRPDGDSIGSSYGLMHLIKTNFPEKEVYVTGEHSDYVSFIGKPNFIDEKKFSNALSICLDTATDLRLSDKRYNLSNYSIKIDHHLKDKVYCDYEYIDELAPATAQIIIEFYLKFKNELVMSKECAEALYVGLITDTGGFKHSNVTRETFICASELIQYIDLDYINKMLSSESVDLLRLKGYCLENFKITDNNFAYITLTKEIINKYNVSEEDAASLVYLISSIDKCLVWAMFLETDSEIRVRLRSGGPDINMLAVKYNGGGHKLASGAKLYNWNELQLFIKDVDELIIDYNEIS